MSAVSERPHFRRVALLGIGLVNGSLALVMRREGLADEIVACARTEATLAKARALGLADRTTTVPSEAVAGADLVVLGTPVGACGAVAEAMAPGLNPAAIVSDVGISPLARRWRGVMSAAVIIAPRAMMTARSTAFFSSRTLPGQW